MILKSYPLRLQFLINESTDYGEMKKVNKRCFRQTSFIWRCSIPAKDSATLYSVGGMPWAWIEKYILFIQQRVIQASDRFVKVLRWILIFHINFSQSFLELLSLHLWFSQQRRASSHSLSWFSGSTQNTSWWETESPLHVMWWWLSFQNVEHPGQNT